MTSFTIRTINSSYFTETQVDEPQAEDALATGVRGALMIAADEIYGGTAASVVEVAVDDAGGRLVSRSAVMVSVAPLAVRSAVNGPLPEGTDDR